MPLVFHLVDRIIRPGLDPRLVDFFLWWEERGPFPITIPPDGGWRTDEAKQAALYAQGRTSPGPHAGDTGYPPLGLTVTAARTLAETAHGRKAAADSYPAVLSADGKRVASILVDDRAPKVRLKFHQYGILAEEHGLVWGGRWKRRDCPHVECPQWKSLPIPNLKPS